MLAFIYMEMTIPILQEYHPYDAKKIPLALKH